MSSFQTSPIYIANLNTWLSILFPVYQSANLYTLSWSSSLTSLNQLVNRSLQEQRWNGHSSSQVLKLGVFHENTFELAVQPSCYCVQTYSLFKELMLFQISPNYFLRPYKLDFILEEVQINLNSRFKKSIRKQKIEKTYKLFHILNNFNYKKYISSVNIFNKFILNVVILVLGLSAKSIALKL